MNGRRWQASGRWRWDYTDYDQDPPFILGRVEATGGKHERVYHAKVKNKDGGGDHRGWFLSLATAQGRVTQIVDGPRRP